MVARVIVEKITHQAQLPVKPKSQDDACWDVYVLDRVDILPGKDALLSTGLKVKIPQGYCIQVNPRSGRAVKNKITVGARIIDSPYRGELMIHLFNNSQDTTYEVSPHEPVAQLLVLQCAAEMVEGIVDDETERGSDGFGSTDGILKYRSMNKTDNG